MNQKRITNQILEQKNYTLNSTLNYLFNISNMKKLFSYLLISSMVVLSSCTNYDDQFDDLNTQINTLKTQIEGFSSLSSGLTSLQGTVASLQSAIANIPVTPATDISGLESTQAALQTALTALATEVTALQTSLAAADTSTEVAALTLALDKVKTDLAELLASNNVYSPTGTFTISTPAQLTFAENLGGKIAIINGSVSVTQGSTMDATKLAAVLAKMTSITGSLTYEAKGTSVVPTAGFTALTGVGDLTVDTDGAISFPKLVSADNVILKTNAKTTSVSFPALTSLTDLGGAAEGDDVLSFTAATSFDMGLLSKYSASSLSITIKSGLVNLDALQIFAANGTTKEVTALTINGATEISLDALTEGEIDANKVVTVDFPIWKGNTSSVFTKATTVVLPKIEANGVADTYAIHTMFPNATSVHIIGAAKATSTTVTATPSVTSHSQNNLETLILDGVLDTVDVNSASDLTSVTHTGTAVNVVYYATGATSLDLGYTAGKTGATNATAKNGGLTIENNSDLTSFTADKLDDITSLKVRGNANLAAISMAALNSVGTATAASVEISGNDLTVESIQLASAAGALPVVAKTIKSADLGPLKTYIEAAKAKVGTTGSIIVVADTVTAKLNADGTAATVVPGDKTIANFLTAAARTSNMVGGTAKVEEFYFAAEADHAFSVNGFNSSVTGVGGSDIAYDLAAWAAKTENVAGFAAAGVTVTTGNGPHTGKATLTALDTTTGAHTYSIAINGTTYSVTTAGASTADLVVEALRADIDAGKDVATDKDFTVASLSGEISITSSSKGSASSAFTIGAFKSNLGTSTALGAGVGTNTNASGVVTAMVRPTTSGYVRVAVNTAGLVAAGLRVPTFTGGATSPTQLTSNGGTPLTTTTGDNENVVAAKDGTSQTNAAAILTASVYEADHLAS